MKRKTTKSRRNRKPRVVKPIEISAMEIPLSDVRKFERLAGRGRTLGVVHKPKTNYLVADDGVPVIGTQLANCALQLSEAVCGITQLSLQLLNSFGISHKRSG